MFPAAPLTLLSVFLLFLFSLLSPSPCSISISFSNNNNKTNQPTNEQSFCARTNRTRDRFWCTRRIWIKSRSCRPTRRWACPDRIAISSTSPSTFVRFARRTFTACVDFCFWRSVAFVVAAVCARVCVSVCGALQQLEQNTRNASWCLGSLPRIFRCPRHHNKNANNNYF